MAFSIIDEEYNGLAALYANAGKWVTGEVKVSNTFTIGSGVSNTFTASGLVISLQSGLWGTAGFAAGDSITISFFSYLAGINYGAKSYTRTITYINGNLLYIDTTLPAPFTNLVYPTTGQVAGMLIQANKLPQQIDFNFNLTPSGTSSINSIIDGQVNRFKALTGSAVVATPIAMAQQGFKSGGLLEDVTITRTADTGTGGITKNFTISFKFLQWGLFLSGQTFPVWYNAADCLTTAVQCKSYSLVGNPNGMATAVNGVKEANTGYFGENYNGGVASYIFNSIDLFDALANPISQIDYSGPTTFSAKLTTPNQTNGVSVYRIGVFFAPEDDTLFKNLPTGLGNNLLLSAPDVNFLHSGTPSPTVYSGLVNAEGVSIDLTNLQFNHVAGVLTVSGLLTVNYGETFFGTIADGGRKLVMYVQVSNSATSGTSNDETNVVIYSDDCFNAPTLGVQIPTIVAKELIDHGGEDVIVATVGNITTEDDVLFNCALTLPEAIVFEGVRCAISARNTVTGENFTLETQTLSFANVPYIAGIYEANISVPRNFLLPPTSDRNAITLTRYPSLDGGGQYGLLLQYGFLTDWRYWQELSAVNDFFFDAAEDFNGKNRNWQRFFTGDWGLFLEVFTQKDGVEDYDRTEIKPRTYEDEPSVSLATVITSPDGSNPTTFLAGAESGLALYFSWDQLFDSSWVQVTAENKEGARIGFVSSVLDQGNISTNILKPVAGQTKLILAGNGTNTLATACKVDLTDVAASDISLTYRVFSLPKGTLGYIIQARKDAKLAYSLQKISPDSVYAGPCINVRRDSDNTFMDIGFLGSALDTAALLAFVGAGSGYVRTWYDQGGGGLNAGQVTLSKQPIIATAGVVSTDPTNGLPAIEFDGVNDFFDLSQIFTMANNFLQTWVFNLNGGFSCISLANATPNVLSGSVGVALEVATFVDVAAVSHGFSPEAGLQLMTTSHEFSTGDTTVYINGVPLNDLSEAVAGNSFEYLGRLGGSYHSGFFQELVYWDRDKSAEKAIIDSNTILRYGL